MPNNDPNIETLLTITVDLLANVNSRLERIENLITGRPAADAGQPTQAPPATPPPYPNQAARIAADFAAATRKKK